MMGRSDTATDEVWRDVPGFEGIYRVSNMGRVLSLERRCDVAGGTRRVRQRVLKRTVRYVGGKIESCGVKLSRPKSAGSYYNVGRVVLLAFGRPPEDGEIAHFKDGDPTNASVENLEWSTRQAVGADHNNRRGLRNWKASQTASA